MEEEKLIYFFKILAVRTGVYSYMDATPLHFRSWFNTRIAETLEGFLSKGVLTSAGICL